MTNFERIKAMSVDEMAKAFELHTACSICPAYKVCPDKWGKYDDCCDFIKKWLEREVENGKVD